MRTNKMNKIPMLAAVLAAAFSLPVHATIHSVMADSSRVVDLDEVVVVSQPKENVRLRLQPLSSTVVTSDEMNRLHATDLRQLSASVPSFVMPDYGSRYTSAVYVRGIGSRINNPAVGIYYDNIPLMSKSAFNTHFYMLDRVDVLRGPQGTLYGQNAEGGLVRIYSRNPMSYQGTDVSLGLGTGLYSNVEVAHYHRPTDKLAFTAAAFYSGLKGFVDNQGFDEKNDLTNEAGGKMRFIYAPTSRLTFDLTTDYQYVNQNGFGYGEMTDDDVADPATTIMNGYKRNMLNTGLNVSYDTRSLLLTSTTSYQYLRDLMVMDQDYMSPDYLRLLQRQKQNALTQELVLRSHTASRWQHASGLFGSYQWLRTDAPVLFGEAITGPIGNAITTAMKNAMIPAMLQRFVAQGMDEEQARQMAQQTVDGMGINMTAEMAVPECFHTPQASLAAFHESSLLLGDRLRATLGLRLNHDIVKIDYSSLAYMAMTGGTANAVATYTLTSHVADKLSKSYTQLLPKLGLTYQLDNNLGNVYATVAKGYRAGGYNIQMFSDILQTDLTANQQKAMRGDYDVPHTDDDYRFIEETISYKPEESWNYEVGSHLNLLGGRVHADLALYYMQVRNQQLSVMSPGYNYGRFMVNAGKSHTLGAELALRGKAVEDVLDWSVAYAFTSAKLDDYYGSALNVSSHSEIPQVVLVNEYKGNYVPFVPQHTFSAMADCHLGKLTLGLNLTGRGKTWWNEANDYAQNFYAVLGAHADYALGNAVVSLWGRNLTDTKYNTFAIESSATGVAHRFAQRATPIQLGMDVRFHF